MVSLFLFFILGLMGSGHCVGMCGPFVMGYTRPERNPWYAHVLYGLGRATTYAILGMITSGFGQILQGLLGLRASILIVAGVIMIYLALGQLHLFPVKLLPIQNWRWYQETVGRLYASQQWYRTYPLGLILGYIPCGLTAIALSFAITQPAPLATLGMFLFGLGTMPAMIGFGLLIQRLKIPKFQRYVALSMVIFGSLTLWMGVHRLGWVPAPPQSALLMQLHPTSFPSSDHSPDSMPHHHHHH